MNKAQRVMLQAGLATGTLGALMAGSLMFAFPAAAQVTGYNTGYQYVQGLAIGDGAMLENGAVASSAIAPTGTGVTSVAPTTGVSTAQAPATSPAVAPAANTATQNAVAPATQTVNAGLSTPVKVALWAVIILAILALIAGGIAALNRTDRESRKTRTYYQG